MPPDFKMIGDLMYFPTLDAAGAPPLLCLGFRLTDDGSEYWTKHFNAVKAREEAAVEAGARSLAAAFSTIVMNPVGVRMVVVGAISSADTVLAASAPVRRMGEVLAARQGWEWRPELLTKRSHRSLHGIRAGAAARQAEVTGAYTSSTIGGVVGKVLILDDIATRGDTAADIVRAVLATNPGWGTCSATLAKSERSAYWANNGGISNDHVPARVLATWAGR